MPVFQLNTDITFPAPDLAEPNGLLAIGGDLSAPRLLEAYRRGIFPWYGEGEPLLWWSPAPRLVLFPDEFHLPKRLARTIRQQLFTITTDTSFAEIIKSCAQTRKQKGEETWITEEMQQAYSRLHELGFAHSIECRYEGKIVGGLYGVALGQVFFGESMFSRKRDSSKVALSALVSHALKTSIKLIDCQMTTEHLLGFGAREISREYLQKLLHRYATKTMPQKKWRLC
ncbi:MAG: leucyl/phenylalanyl-tRNA--protein transferase [Proteobacteria bacterium]|nr:leucyl/phenylalanyl-tRNA--protein transferase [Pseudomonadota bacterium]